MTAREFQKALELLAITDPAVLRLPISHPIVRAAFQEVAEQEETNNGIREGRPNKAVDFTCAENHAESPSASHWFDTGTELFLHLLTCPAFAMHHGATIDRGPESQADG